MQFDVFTNPIAASRRAYPYLLCLQSPLLAAHSNQVVAPLATRRSLTTPGSRIAPVVQIDDADYVVLVPALTTLPAKELSRRVANLARHRDALLGAVDLLFYGT